MVSKITCIIVAFAYQDKSLKSSIIDAYRVYKWAISYGYNIKLLIDRDLIESINSRKIKIWVSQITPTIITNNLLDSLRKIKIDDKLIFYFSGHGVGDGILLPNRIDKILWGDIRSILDDNNREILWIMDCCYSNSLKLPYIYHDKFIYDDNEEKIWTNSKILLITSSNKTEKSNATPKGSIFTKYLISYLNTISKNRSLLSLHKYLNNNIKDTYKQTITLYASYPNISNVWFWVSNRYDIQIINKFLIIQNIQS